MKEFELKNRLEIQERFLKEDAQKKLGHLASDLARAASLIEMQMSRETIEAVMEESKFFAEWAVQDREPELQMFLAEIQSSLALTALEWESFSTNSEWRQQVVQSLRKWSDGLLKKAGWVSS